MFLVYVILAIVSICVTIVVTYFLLNNEDYRWAWTSFLASASTCGAHARTVHRSRGAPPGIDLQPV
jgi:hypothetical protein